MCVYLAFFSHRGTGFVGNIEMGKNEQHFIITCNHVIPNKAIAEDSKFSFNYIDVGEPPNKVYGRDLFNMTVEQWFWTDEVRKTKESFTY